MKKKMKPQPKWEETPGFCESDGLWCGRYRFITKGSNGHPAISVGVWEAKPPRDMSSAEPLKIGETWYWATKDSTQ